jgi:outer membrane protein insertion porin family
VKRLLIASIIGLLLATQAFPQSHDDAKVNQVTLRGNRRIDEKTIKSWISSRKGDTYNTAKLDRDVRALFDTGHFEDIKVYVEDDLRSGKIIIFEVRERPIITDVIYEMDNSSDEAKIEEELERQDVKLSQGDEYNPVRLRKAARVIEEYLLREGRGRAKVYPFVEEETGIEVRVIFKVREKGIGRKM